MTFERRSGSPGQQEVAGPGLKALVEGVKQGDGASVIGLDQYLSVRLEKIVGSIPNREDVLQEAKAKIFTRLGTFDPELTPELAARGFDTNFNAWSGTIARNEKQSERRRLVRAHGQTVIYEDKAYNMPRHEPKAREDIRHNTALREFLRKRINEVLTVKSHRAIVGYLLDGKTEAEVAADLKTSVGSVKVRLHHARKIIEQEILYPAGFKRLASFVSDQFSISALGDHVQAGRIETLMFLYLHYTTQEAVDDFKRRVREKSEAEIRLQERGLWRATKVLSATEYSRLVHSGAKIIINGGIYVHNDTIEELRANTHRKNEYRFFPEGLCQIAEAASTHTEYSALGKALGKGLIPGVKQRGRWYVDSTTAHQFLEARKAAKKKK